MPATMRTVVSAANAMTMMRNLRLRTLFGAGSEADATGAEDGGITPPFARRGRCLSLTDSVSLSLCVRLVSVQYQSQNICLSPTSGEFFHGDSGGVALGFLLRRPGPLGILSAPDGDRGPE